MTQLVGQAEAEASVLRVAAPALLAVDGVTMRFGGVVALDGVRFAEAIEPTTDPPPP